MIVAAPLLLSLCVLGAAPQEPPAIRQGVQRADAAPKAIDALAMAEFAPADVTLYVHLEGGAQLRKELTGRPISRWLKSVTGKGEIKKAWSAFAAAMHADDEALFDQIFGRRVTLMMRGDLEWAALIDIDEKAAAAMIRRLNMRVREPRHAMAIAEWPEQDMLFARDGRMLVIGPAKQSALLYDLLSRLETRAAASTSRFAQGAHQPDDQKLLGIERARELGTGQIVAIVRHAAELGGYSAVVANLDGDQLKLKHYATFKHPPFNHGITKLECDYTPLLNFKDAALLATIQPMDVTDGPVESFMSATLGEGLISQRMRENLGDRRLVVIGEEEGRQLERPVDLLSTSVVVCMQVKDREPAIQQLDEQMIKLTGRLNALGQGAFVVPVPRVSAMKIEEPRHVDLGGAGEWFTGGFPVMKNLSLTWTVTDGANGPWFVIGSHRRSLDQVTGLLKKEAAGNVDIRLTGRYDSCGVGNGVRLSRHLRSWSDQAAQFTDADRIEEFRETLALFSELAAGMQSTQWQLERPTAEEMRLNLQIKLAPAETGGP